jgi:hypothetical protein
MLYYNSLFIPYYFIFPHVIKCIGFNLQTTTKTMPESNIHRGDEDIGGVQNHSYYHNVKWFPFVSHIACYFTSLFRKKKAFIYVC